MRRILRLFPLALVLGGLGLVASWFLLALWSGDPVAEQEAYRLQGRLRSAGGGTNIADPAAWKAISVELDPSMNPVRVLARWRPTYASAEVSLVLRVTDPTGQVILEEGIRLGGRQAGQTGAGRPGRKRSSLATFPVRTGGPHEIRLVPGTGPLRGMEWLSLHVRRNTWQPPPPAVPVAGAFVAVVGMAMLVLGPTIRRIMAGGAPR